MVLATPRTLMSFMIYKDAPPIYEKIWMIAKNPCHFKRIINGSQTAFINS